MHAHAQHCYYGIRALSYQQEASMMLMQQPGV
jgi:hypothetical protein